MHKPFRVAVAIAGLLAASLVGGCSPEVIKKAIDHERAREVDSELVGDPTYGPSFVYLRDHMPADYARLRSGVMSRVEAGKSRQEISTFTYYFAKRLTVEHTADFIAASSPAMERYRAAQVSLFEGLQQESIPLCSHFAAPAGPKPDIELGVQSHRAAAGLLNAELEAIVDGRTSGALRPAPTKSTYRALAEAMKVYGMEHDDMMAFATEQRFAAQSDARKCDLTIKLLKAINSLPPEQADPLTVEQYKAAAQQAADMLKKAPPEAR